ncbi:dienelactone hydrolase family protein [Arthrobacter sp. I2-34]|uniref:Dienelactone hydrolase family protein n=1 Tax=Arthrobacter hankyongi TaxID=2904801 RepID=A0ABS9L5S0_9MICC|nr:dienelactone hydrolase family protein [Arthrobacter hankyongi]MCG2622022.1 dienelactone hydrolase family protein [Arthrobacter hankyongi]
MGEMIQLGNGDGGFGAYRSYPEDEIRGALIVIHEIWGLVDHIKEVADRFAAEGYLALAPDLLAAGGLDSAVVGRLGADLADPAKRAQAQPRLREATAPLHAPAAATRIKAALKESFDYLDSAPEGEGRTGVVGYCFGGTYSFALAAAEPRLQAAVPYYGSADLGPEELGRIACPVLAFYGEQDRRLMDGLPALRQRFAETGADFQAHVYPGTGHAFFNDTNPAVYNPAAAEDAWRRTLAFLHEHLE